MGRGEFFSVHVGYLVHSFAWDNMYEFEIDCLILAIFCMYYTLYIWYKYQLKYKKAHAECWIPLS
jgi:hypothetical protein